MAFQPTQLYISRGRTNDGVGSDAMAEHTYIHATDTLADITTSGYFPANFGVRDDDVKVNDLITIRASDGISTYTIDAISPVSMTEESPGGGDVDGAASSTDNAITRFDGATGKVIQNSVGLLDDNGNVTLPGNTHRLGNNADATDTVVHVQSVNDSAVWLEADTQNSGGENQHPVVYMSQDLNGTMAQFGFTADNQFVFNRSGAGAPTNNVIFKVSGTVSGGGTAGMLPTLSGGTDALTLEAGTGTTIVNVGLELPTSGGTATTLDYYEESLTNSLTITGAITGTTNARFVRIGKLVTMTVTGEIAAVGTPGTLITLSGIPARFQISSTAGASLGNCAIIVDNSNVELGELSIPDGQFQRVDVFKDDGTNFTGNAGFHDFTMSWVLN